MIIVWIIGAELLIGALIISGQIVTPKALEVVTVYQNPEEAS